MVNHRCASPAGLANRSNAAPRALTRLDSPFVNGARTAEITSERIPTPESATSNTNSSMVGSPGTWNAQTPSWWCQRMQRDGGGELRQNILAGLCLRVERRIPGRAVEAQQRKEMNC